MKLTKIAGTLDLNGKKPPSRSQLYAKQLRNKAECEKNEEFLTGLSRPKNDKFDFTNIPDLEAVLF